MEYKKQTVQIIDYKSYNAYSTSINVLSLQKSSRMYGHITSPTFYFFLLLGKSCMIRGITCLLYDDYEIHPLISRGKGLKIIGINSLPTLKTDAEKALDITKGLILFDSDLKVSSIDNGAKQILGLSNQAVIGHFLPNLLDKDVFEILLNNIYSVIQEDLFVQQDFKVSDHPVQWYNTTIFPISKNRYSILLVDNTKQKIMEKSHINNNEKLKVLYDTASKLTTMKNPKELLDSLFDSLAQVLDLDIYINYIWDKEQERLELANHKGICNEKTEYMRFIEKGSAVCGTVAQNMKKMVVENVEYCPNPKVDLIRSFGIKAYVCEPLISFGELVGTISFGSKKRTTFKSEELDLIHSICHQVTIVLDRMTKVEELTQNTETLEVANLHLMKNERKFRDIFEGAQVGILIIDNDGKIIELNPAAGYILGVHSERLNGVKVTTFVSETNKVSLREHGAHLLKYGKAQDNEYIIIRPDESERIISFSASKNISYGHHLIIFHDLTLQKNIQNSLIIERNEAERASKTKTNFLAMIGHELRTPLNSIIGFSQVLEEDQKDPLTEKQKKRLGKILSSSRHLLQLINNILELIRIDTKPETIKANVKTVRIKNAIWDCLQANKNNAADNGVTLHIEKDVEDISIKIDPIRFQQVLVNLLNNAIKYNKKNGTVTLYWRVDGSYLAIFVKDTGIGIPVEHQENIFEPFYRINHPAYHIEGTGIGLTLVKQNVFEMKGTVGVSSIEGTGSTFWIKVPL